MKGQAGKEVRNVVSHIEMQEAKGKARTKGLPVSERSTEFKSGTMLWNSPAGQFPTAWDTNPSKRSSLEAEATARATRY